ncbi:AbrB/MazE/SpoVT family DNA-binding domain-containing protein [Eupransor demetentiae]|uniref:Uncharacterized protein n=1 Tax=Eupransor demetentiae TaxID=3109584 RepID=A0ABP0EU78_9LACO|nr:hypothetical protein R54876_GBNLAHCA_01514 [Lactobacillaceae bacterium LMG 33000]
MSQENYQLQIPQEVVNDLKLKRGEELEVTVKNRGLTVSKTTTFAQQEDISIRWFLVPTILATAAFVIAAWYLHEGLVHLTGPDSIATAVIVLGEISGMAGFSWTYINHTRNRATAEDRRLNWRLTPTVLIAFAIIQAFMTMGVFWAIGYLFQGASFDHLTATVLFFMFVSVVNFLMIYAAQLVSTPFIMGVLILTIVGGVLVSMVTNSRLLWWQHNFSFLGTEKAEFAWNFNATLIIAGILWVTLVDYLFVPIQNRYRGNWRLMVLRTFLTLDALSLAAVGAIPNNPGLFHILHDSVANSLILFTAIPMLGIKFLLPRATKEFMIFTYLTAGALAVAMSLFYIITYLSLTAFEIIALALAISWLLLLMQNIYKLFQTDVQSYIVKLQ